MQILEKLDIDLSKIELDQSYSNNSLGLNFSYCVSEHSHQEIDKMNILQASLSAMKNACGKIQDKKSKILVDGNKVFESSTAIESIIKGDSKVIAIALASIIAKEYRDKKMKEYDALYPGYNLSQHAGYPTKEHRDAVKKIGPSAIHRKSFKGVKEYL
jgi:ribonuclease HII